MAAGEGGKEVAGLRAISGGPEEHTACMQNLRADIKVKGEGLTPVGRAGGCFREIGPFGPKIPAEIICYRWINPSRLEIERRTKWQH